jgi:threonine dehydratase
MGPDLATIKAAAARLQGVTIATPVLPLTSARWDGLPKDAKVTVKLELFQQAGSFKARGAYLGMAGLDDAARAAGVVAASGGNHALAVAWAAQAAGVQALIAMPRATDPGRIQGCRDLGATVSLHDDMAAAFAVMEDAAREGRTLLHPFEAPHMVLGAATCGLEYLAQVPDLDVVIVPVGGGGLIAGMACALRQARPDLRVIGVEPTGADSMFRSLQAGSPQRLAQVATIADSLGSPLAMPETFAITRHYVDHIVHVTDDAMRHAMRSYQSALKIMAEPACAAALAAIQGPLCDALAGQHVGIIAYGSNISLARYTQLLDS